MSKSRIIQCRVTEEERQIIEKKAKENGMTVSRFVALSAVLIDKITLSLEAKSHEKV